MRYHSSEQCEEICPTDHYADEDSMACEKCSEECRECYGPGTLQCKACRNYRVYLENNSTLVVINDYLVIESITVTVNNRLSCKLKVQLHGNMSTR